MILITGGTGAMGSVLVKKLAQNGKRIRVFCLKDDKFVSRIKDYVYDIKYGDISCKEDVSNICENVKIVYHLAAIIISKNENLFEKINVNGTKNIVEEAKKSNVTHFIHVSSASVVYPVPTPYSLSKIKAEEIVKKSGLNYTILRPTLVYGENGGLEFDIYLDYLKKFPFVPFIGKGNAIKRPVYVEDVIDGLYAVCDNLKTFGKIYNLSGGEPISMMNFTKLCLRLLGIPNKPIICIPVFLCKVIAKIMKLFMDDPPLKWQTIAGIITDANLDPSEAALDLGYKPKNVSLQLPKVFPRKSQ